MLVEASNYNGFRVGETLPPNSKLMMQHLGVWDRFEQSGHLPSPGIISLWGSDAPYYNDFVFNPHGLGWHLDRRRFDAMMAEAAADAGARVLRGSPITSASYNGAWSLTASSREDTITLKARFLIDAAGRSSWPGRPARSRQVVDRLVAIVGVFQHNTSASAVDQRTLIEAICYGWWYCASIPDGRVVAAFFTDSDLVAGGRNRIAKLWCDFLSQAPHTADRLRGHHLWHLRLFPATSTLAACLSGTGWITVGDAACTFDPLSSYGLSHALASGVEAAQTILRSGPSRAHALQDYDTQTRDRFSRYMRTRNYYYRRERRWPDSDFWHRRILLDPNSEEMLQRTDLPRNIAAE